MVTWLSTEQASREVGVTVRTLYRMIDAGELPAYRFGRVIRLKPADVEAFIESCRIPMGGMRWTPKLRAV